MSQIEAVNFFKNAPDQKARTAIFVSGSGTNAEKLLDFWQNENNDCSYEPVCIITDRPGRCRAEFLSSHYNLPLISEDLVGFYKSKGLESTSLASEEGRKVREEWTAALYKQIEDFKIDFGIFAGFVPLTNITDHFPCLNVHPGDLTECDANGERILVGLHTLPIHKALVEGFDCLRSSVIVACAYEDGGSGMDEGIVLGISEEVSFDYLGRDREYWMNSHKSRPAQKPNGGWGDEYQNFLSHNQEKLKISGDWVVFPQVVNDFAMGKFSHKAEKLFYKSGKSWLPIKIIEYSETSKEIFFKD